jgi:RNA polymerase-binding transcription factor DksA
VRGTGILNVSPAKQGEQRRSLAANKTAWAAPVQVELLLRAEILYTFPMTQHKPEFIAEMKEALQRERQHLLTELKETGDFPEYGRNDEDNATEVADYEATSATKRTLQERLKSIEEALEHIKSGTYGLTPDGKLIPEERLRANPAATTTVQ